jgi:hypothetical protein
MVWRRIATLRDRAIRSRVRSTLPSHGRACYAVAAAGCHEEAVTAVDVRRDTVAMRNE